MRRLALLTIALLCLGAATAWAQRSESDAQALAQAVNLTADDMPGYKASPAGPDDLSDDLSFVRCSKILPSSQAVAMVSSPSFERESLFGYRSVSSEVVVRPSAELAARDVKAYASSRMRRCMAKYMRLQGGKHLLKVSVKPLRPRVPHGTGFRIAMLVRVSGHRVKVFIDLLMVVHDDVEAMLSVAGGPNPPLTRADENELLNLIESRLVAQQQPPPAG